MIKLIIFDLDGVLIEAKQLHYEALNDALNLHSEDCVISWNEHLSKYDGLKTKQKLDMLTKEKGLDINLHSLVWEEKQRITNEKLKSITPNFNLSQLLKKLSEDGFKIACCSNSIRKTVLTVLSKLDIIEYFDQILSNEDVKNSKPHPEIYWKVISEMGVISEETLIVEDSPYGLLAASRTHAPILRVTSPKEVTIDNLYRKLKELNTKFKMKKPKWTDEKLNVLIPMAGAGSRFEKAGYTFPKPLIDVEGDPMIKLVSENLNLKANFIYIVQKSHREKYNLDTLLNLISPNCKIVEVDGLTEGAACTTLLAKDYIDNDFPLVMANSDQFIEWDSNEFMYKMSETNCDGGIVTFKSTHPKWSFAKVNENGLVTEVAEKNPISDIATVGVYYWKKGSDYVKYTEQMINKNIRVNNEFYVCPVFNEAIQNGKEVRTFEIPKMWGLGTPEDLTTYLRR
jgi:HAD superfamily hydrolase (TIGR01509 family)